MKKIMILAIVLIASTPQVAICKNSTSQNVASSTQDMNPKLILSFIASADEHDVYDAQKIYQKFDLAGGALLQGTYRDDTFLSLLVKNSLWIPYVKGSYERLLGDGSVILDPLMLKRDANNQLILVSALEPALAPHRLLYLSYQEPKKAYDGLPRPPTTFGDVVTPLTMELTPQMMGGKVISYSALIDSLNGKIKKGHMRTVNRDVYNQIIGKTGQVNPNANVQVFDRMALSDVKLYNLDTADAAGQAEAYDRILGIDPQQDPDLVYGRTFLAAEARYRLAQDNEFLTFLTNSDYGRSIRAATDAEVTLARGVMVSTWTSVFGGMGGNGGISGVSGLLSSMQSALQNFVDTASKISNGTDEHNAASTKMASVQVTFLSAQLEGSQSISASSVDELRDKFKQIYSSQVRK